MVVFLEQTVRESFLVFCQIFTEISSDRYDGYQQEEMLEVLEDQTLESHLEFLEDLRRQEGDTETGADLVWAAVEQTDWQGLHCRHQFLRLFDTASQMHGERCYTTGDFRMANGRLSPFNVEDSGISEKSLSN